MKSRKIKYQVMGWALLLTVLPSLIGYSIIQHHCYTCQSNELITAFSDFHIEHHHHEHICCSVNDTHESYYLQNPGDCCHISTSCKEDIKRITFENSIISSSLELKVAMFHLPYTTYDDNVLVDFVTNHSNRNFHNVVLYEPDEPTLEENCVFLL
nr:hypothetical protein [uncultured Carboxylicivirga sp.]